MRITCRPLSDFPAEFKTADAYHRPDQFSASWQSTIDLLWRELDHLEARNPVIELDVTEADIHFRTGMPKANVTPNYPGVIVSFDSVHGPLRYGTDAFARWQSNVRAIALGLEALRKVDRYGIGKRGEQYVGWRQLAAGGDIQRGRELIAEHGGVRNALRATHPDHGGDADDFHAVQAARQA